MRNQKGTPKSLDHDQPVRIVAHLARDAELTEGQEWALAHVLDCPGCLAALEGWYSPPVACALALPRIRTLVQGALRTAALREKIAAHAQTCSVCCVELAFAQEAADLARLPPEERAAAELALALVDAGVGGQAPARALVWAWLGAQQATARDTARDAAALPHPIAAARGRDFLALPSPDEARLRAPALAFLTRHPLELAELGLRLEAGRLREVRVRRPPRRRTVPPRELEVETSRS